MSDTVPLPLPGPPARPAGRLTFSRVLAQLGSGLTLFVGTPTASPLALPFCAPFLIGGETVLAVDGANCFNLYRLTEWARRKRLSSPALLNRLRIARAFTCFQLATILRHMGPELERCQAVRLVITGLPDCLYDEELSEPEARSTFARCLENLARLVSRYTVLAFSDLPPHAVGGRTRFFDSLVSQARFVFEVSHTEPVTFVPLKAPGLVTVTAPPGMAALQGELHHGKNSANR